MSMTSLSQFPLLNHQTRKVQNSSLERQSRTPSEEARWLSAAERMLGIWGPYLKKTEEQFNKYGGIGIEVVGG